MAEEIGIVVIVFPTQSGSEERGFEYNEVSGVMDLTLEQVGLLKPLIASVQANRTAHIRAKYVLWQILSDLNQ